MGISDQMSHYNVHRSVPKTLIQHPIRWVAARGIGRRARGLSKGFGECRAALLSAARGVRDRTRSAISA
jgi:hypothetical protein